MGIGTIALPAAVPGVSAVAAAQQSDDSATNPSSDPAPDQAECGVTGGEQRNATAWPYPDGTQVKKTPIIDTDVNFQEVTGPSSFRMQAIYRTLASPTIKGIDWFYLHFDPELAPYISQITIKSSGALAIGYRRFMEEVKPDSLGSVNRFTAKSFGELDPYAGEPGVWRVLNDMNHIRPPSDDPDERTIVKGQWGVFNAVATQDQRQTAEINVVLNDTIENIKAATGKSYFPAEGRWQGQSGGGNVLEGSKNVVVGASDSSETIRAGSEVPANYLIDTLLDENNDPYSSNYLRVDEGSLPEGTELDYDELNGQLTLVGTPTTPGSYDIKYAVATRGEVSIDNGELMGTMIDFDADDTDIAGTGNWLSGQTKTYLNSGDRVSGIMQPNRSTTPAPTGVTNFRAVSAHAPGVDYNIAYGTPYDIHLKLDPRILAALDGDHVVMWQKGSKLAYENSLPDPVANKQPVLIPVSAFDSNGHVRVSERNEAQNEPNTVYVDDITRVINPLTNTVQFTTPIRVVDMPINNQKLLDVYASDSPDNYLVFETWATTRDGKVDREIKYSRTGAYYHFYQSCAPDVTNIAKGNADGNGDTIDSTMLDTARDTQNFLRGHAEPETEIYVYRGTGADREIIGRTTVQANGFWDTKLCEPADLEANPETCSAKNLADLGIEAGSTNLTVAARHPRTLESDAVPITVIGEPITNEPVADPFPETATEITGKLGEQHQNTTKTVVTAYAIAPDGTRTKIGESEQIAGSANPDAETPFSIPVDRSLIGPDDAIEIESRESSFPADLTGTVDVARDDAYRPSTPVTVDPGVFIGDINTVIKITSDEPDGVFRKGSGVTYTATSTVTDGPVKDAVVIIGEDPDAPFTDEAPVLKKKAADGTETDLVEGTDYTAEKQADGSYKITFTEPLAEDDVVTTVIKGLIPAETPADGDD
ncbi:hypothetical protein, partial [Corynebacterium spheniscorum]